MVGIVVFVILLALVVVAPAFALGSRSPRSPWYRAGTLAVAIGLALVAVLFAFVLRQPDPYYDSGRRYWDNQTDPALQAIAIAAILVTFLAAVALAVGALRHHPSPAARRLRLGLLLLTPFLGIAIFLIGLLFGSH